MIDRYHYAAKKKNRTHLESAVIICYIFIKRNCCDLTVDDSGI